MYKPEIRGVTLAVLCAFPLAAGAQQGLKLKSQPSLILIPPTLNEQVPLFLEADQVRGHNDRDLEAEGDVRLRKRDQALYADWLRHDKTTDEVTAQGNVRIERAGGVVEGPRLQYNLESDRGFMEKPTYTFHQVKEVNTRGQPVPAAGASKPGYLVTDARGSAERLLFEGPNQYRAEHGEFTSCGPGNDDWYLRAGDLKIDKDRDIGVARDAKIVFKGAPIFYSPYLSFSLHQERKSGFLAPHYGSTDKGGAELTVPYYWNIAPNRDATISPRIMTRRGVLLNGQFRYLEPYYFGEARVEYLPEDRVRDGVERHAYFLRHTQTMPSGWYNTVNLQKVSDDTYFTDLSTQIAATSQVLLPREGTIGKNGTWGEAASYNFNVMAQRWQTLQADPLAPVTPPYNRLPQISLTASRQEVLRSDFDFLGQFVAFDHPTLVTGKRTMAYPSFSLPLQTSFATVTPKIGFNATHYAIDPNSTGFTDQNRALPIFSTDGSVVFERPFNLAGKPFLQTLEPRLYYVYIPYRNQNNIPVFDSGLQDINFASIYSENQFAGWDRINDANQVTLGVTSRLVNTESGAERLRAGLAQRFYFDNQRVSLPGVPLRTGTSSDFLAALSGTIAPYWTADAGWQYSTDFSQTQKFNVGTRYQPQPGKVLNLSYRETVDLLRQTDISTQWPVGQGWTGLARWNYSLREHRMLEGLFGAEYNGDCWVLRVVAQRFATTTQTASTTFFVQLELNGVSRLGSNPMDALRRNIGGYTRIDPRLQRSDDSKTPNFY
ncbi:MAG TPA: LPS-assembly protein LptD [Burkholderiales bacterium]|nr:LPS-assembly protein LptD [Burkholderiales bacterium]